jgi:D-glycero-beta-D-manno-heptose-7-phosphate kinase
LTVDRTILQERLSGIIRRFPQRRILVVGDSIADQFVYGSISRVSREAPVFILDHEHTETVPGGAANCAMNLAALGAHVSLVSIAGNDEAGLALRNRLVAAGVNCDALIANDAFKTTTKVRILAGQYHSTRQQVIRIDYGGNATLPEDLQNSIRKHVSERAGSNEAIIVSDYNYGVAEPEIAAFIKEMGAASQIPLLADSRFRLNSFDGFYSATPNQDEVEQQLGRLLKTTEELETAGEELRDRLGSRALLVTRGSQGMMLLEEGVAPVHIQAVGAREPVDVTGAGDTVMAAYTLALASDASFPDAARIANYAGGLVVMKRGTAAVSVDELLASIAHSTE